MWVARPSVSNAVADALEINFPVNPFEMSYTCSAENRPNEPVTVIRFVPLTIAVPAPFGSPVNRLVMDGSE